MIYIFQTDVINIPQIQRVGYELNKTKEIHNWNFDLEDLDNILRIEAPEFDTMIVCKLLESLGHSCNELF